MSDSSMIVSSEPKGLRIALGVVCLVLGVIALIWPQATLLIVAVVFGLQLMAAGVLDRFPDIKFYFAEANASWLVRQRPKPPPVLRSDAHDAGICPTHAVGTQPPGVPPVPRW